MDEVSNITAWALNGQAMIEAVVSALPPEKQAELSAMLASGQVTLAAIVSDGRVTVAIVDPLGIAAAALWSVSVDARASAPSEQRVTLQ